MHLLASFFSLQPRFPRPPLETRLIGPRVILRASVPQDWRAWREVREASRDFLSPWEPEWPANCLTWPYYLRMLRRQDREWRQGKAYAFFVFLRADRLSPSRDAGEALLGGVMLNDVRRGIAQKATLGYWIGYDYARRGLMTEAAGLACAFAFDALRLHRLEASCLPHNEPSTRLLQRLGFEEEGYAKSYLRVNGRWEDHVLWGKAGA